MWVDQKDLKLYITGADMPRIHAAARLVGDLISKAPVNVNSAGVEDEVKAGVLFHQRHQSVEQLIVKDILFIQWLLGFRLRHAIRSLHF